MALGLFAAAVLTDRLPGAMLWRALIYIPVVTSWVVVSYVFAYIFSSQGGVMNAVAQLLRRPPGAASTGRPRPGPRTRSSGSSGIWKGVGWSFVIFLAALDGVPREIVESARIDGATEPRVWRHVVIPSIRPTVIFVFVLLVIGAAQVFTQIYLMTAGGPYNSTQVLLTYMYQQAFTNFEFGYAAAVASLIAVVLFGFSVGRDPACCGAGQLGDATHGNLRARCRPARPRSPRSSGSSGSARRNDPPCHRDPVCASVSLFPLLYMLSLSFQPPSDVFSGTPVLVPTHPTTAELRPGLDREQLRPFLRQQPLRRRWATVVITVVLAVTGRVCVRPVPLPVQRGRSSTPSWPASRCPACC